MLTQLDNGLPIEGNTTYLTNNQGQLSKSEAQVSDKTSSALTKQSHSLNLETVQALLTSDTTMDLVRNEVLNHPDDKQIRNVQWKDVIEKDKVLPHC